MRSHTFHYIHTKCAFSCPHPASNLSASLASGVPGVLHGKKIIRYWPSTITLLLLALLLVHRYLS